MRPLVARISAAALENNLNIARRHAGMARIMAVIKAAAYGHGLAHAAEALKSADGFAVLSLDEAGQLRERFPGKPILLLEGPFSAREARDIAQLRLTPVIHRAEQWQWLAENPQPVDIFIKFNSGMNRLGFALDDLEPVVAQANNNAGVRGVTLMTHFATADDARGVDWQWTAFMQQTAHLNLPVSAANSAALLRHPHTCADWVRPGIMLYGSSPFVDVPAQNFGLKPAMSLHSELIAVQTLRTGQGVGYGLDFVAQQEMRIGIVACGYADGYPRHAPTGTPVLVNGQRTRTLGRVSMDMLAVDLADLPGAGVGSPVVLWGESLSIDEVARVAGTIGYELLCSLAPRVTTVRQ